MEQRVPVQVVLVQLDRHSIARAVASITQHLPASYTCHRLEACGRAQEPPFRLELTLQQLDHDLVEPPRPALPRLFVAEYSPTLGRLGRNLPSRRTCRERPKTSSSSLRPAFHVFPAAPPFASAQI